MCLHPLRIKNKGYKQLGGMPYVDCPCRQCAECADTLQIDYFVRAWSLYRFLPSNWSVWFCTFTFDSENCPKSSVIARQWSDINGWYFTKIGETLCFDHRILHRFCKSYRQYYRRLGFECPHMLFTSEFGEKFGRPHYHGIVFVPRQFSSWLAFREEITRFWHYGFVKNIAIRRVDCLNGDRSVENCFKYVTKYACKGNIKMPYYFNHGDRVFLADIEPCHYTPRVFCTHGFGKALEAVLSEKNYEDNKVVFSVCGKYKQFNLPAYYRRRHYCDTVILKKEKYYTSTYWNPRKVCYRVSSIMQYKNNYETLRLRNLEKRFRIEYDSCSNLLDGSALISRDDFIKWRLLDYNANKERRYIYKRVTLPYDPVNSDGLKVSDIYSENCLSVSKHFVSLHPDNTYYDEKVPLFNSLFQRHSDFDASMRSKYGDSYLSILLLLEYKLICYRSAELRRRMAKKDGERVSSERWYREHNVKKSDD